MQLGTQIVPVAVPDHCTIWEAIDALLKSQQVSGTVLRWGLVSLTGHEALIEIATASGDSAEPPKPKIESGQSGANGVIVSLVIPTGVGADIGGFIGDAGPVAKALGAVADLVIVHPNVVNAADFYAGSERTVCVDGFTLDEFFKGKTQIARPHHARIGVVIDRLEAQLRSRIINAINGLRAVAGVDVIGYVECEEKIQSWISRSKFGHYTGQVENADVLFHAAQRLQEEGANALAVVTAIAGIPKEEVNRHYMGNGPNPVGSVEALISRFITWKTGLPCAHAPAFVEGLGDSSAIVDSRAASEVASGSGLPCLLFGLSQAAQVVQHGGIGVRDLCAIIVPFDCAGGLPARAAHQFRVPLLAVKANKCIIGAAANRLNVGTTVALENYAEVIAFLACRRAGVSWESIRRPLELSKPITAFPHVLSRGA